MAVEFSARHFGPLESFSSFQNLCVPAPTRVMQIFGAGFMAEFRKDFGANSGAMVAAVFRADSRQRYRRLIPTVGRLRWWRAKRMRKTSPTVTKQEMVGKALQVHAAEIMRTNGEGFGPLDSLLNVIS